jgi:hypothetical protein
MRKNIFLQEIDQEIEKEENHLAQIVFEEELKFREWKILSMSNTLSQLMKQDEKEQKK